MARTGDQLSGLFGSGGKIDKDLYEELETILITADVGMDATRALLADLRHRVKEHRLNEASQIKEALAHCLLKLLEPWRSRCEPMPSNQAIRTSPSSS